MKGIGPDRRSALAGLAAAGLAGAAQAKGHGMAKFTADGPAGMRRVLEEHLAKGSAPGLVALLDRDGETETFVLGTMALGAAEPVRRDTIFRIASMTKLVTAAAIMMLVDEGKLRLDEPVDRLLPELANRRVLKRQDGPLDETVPANRPITVEDLLTFRLGWGILFDDGLPINKAAAELGICGFGMPNPEMPFGLDEWLKRLGRLPLMAQPGEQWLYTTGSDVQGALVARASGTPLDVFVRERITGPLGMKDTGFGTPPEKADRLATGYFPNNGKLELFDESGAKSRYAHPPKFPEGDSGLVSTADDLLAFSRMLLTGGRHSGGRVLSEASVRAMTTNHLTPAQAKAGEEILRPGHGWGYGMSVLAWPSPDGLQPGAFGWSGGFGTSWYMDPARGLTTILLTQRVFDSADPPALHKDVWAASYRTLA
ncbi:MAG TPA: serine hydrolase domain-containing protein [Phenylobacterium sp.]|nr:serine hydrolase domain-containing protein [Phenylobacterium sp.]